MKTHKRGEAPAWSKLSQLLGKLIRIPSSVAPVVLTDGMAAAIRETHLSYMPCITGKRCHAYPQHRVMNPPPCKYKFDLNNTVNCKVGSFHMRYMFFTRCCGCGGEDVFPLNACIAAAFPKGPRERPIRFSLPSKASAGGPPRPRPCKSCKSLRTRPSSKKNARRVKRRPHNRPRRHFLVL